MRIPLRHPPPGVDPAPARCAYLEALAEASIGLPLGPAALHLSSRRSRGRHGNALQWHLGLAAHDGDAKLDWEDRVEIKLVTVWASASDRQTLRCDKLKVCDLAIDPWHKLSNVLWVFADRLTRVVVGAAMWQLAGDARVQLAKSWTMDPHFDQPDLFVESRDSGSTSAPAYYLSSRWFRDQRILPPPSRCVFSFDAKWWSEVRAETRGPPLATVISEVGHGLVRCPRCSGELRFDPRRLVEQGWAPAHHTMPLGEQCAVSAHYVVRAQCLHPGRHQTTDEFRAALEGTMSSGALWRLTDRVPEPEDHLHG